MTWQLASFLLLAAALAAGFAWYERSHPSARVLALVGTLAALAVLGRIAFAAIPNVKPTTTIVLLAGYVFGGAPGYAVGAVAALASNVFFAQGPWTPWQMLAWGGVGVFGAVLARLSRGRMGRVPLAVACGAAGLGFGVIVNFGSVVTFGDAELWRRYVAYQSVSLPWDVAHALANVAFFALFGPALVRTLRRFRTRMEFTWRPAAAPSPSPSAPRPAAARAPSPQRAALVLAALLVVASGPLLAALAAPPRARAAQAAAAQAATPAGYLARAQNRDGGFGGAPGQSSVDLYTGWAALGLAAQGRNPAQVRRPGGRSAIDYVRAHAQGLAGARSADRVGDLERTVLVVTAAGLSPRRFAGQDLAGALARRVGRDGAILGQVNLTSFGILALRSAGVPAAAATLRHAGRWLARQQNRDGGFGFSTKGTASDVDDTAAALQALVASGRRAHRATIARGVAFLRRNQNPDGGLPLMPGGTSNAASTAWAIQGFVAAGVRPEAVRRHGSRSAFAYLTSLVGPGGVVQFSRSSRQTPVWVTAYGAMALAHAPFPLRPGARTASAGPTASSSSSSGGGPGAALLVPLAAAVGLAGVAAVVIARREKV